MTTHNTDEGRPTGERMDEAVLRPIKLRNTRGHSHLVDREGRELFHAWRPTEQERATMRDFVAAFNRGEISEIPDRRDFFRPAPTSTVPTERSDNSGWALEAVACGSCGDTQLMVIGSKSTCYSCKAPIPAPKASEASEQCDNSGEVGRLKVVPTTARGSAHDPKDSGEGSGENRAIAEKIADATAAGVLDRDFTVEQITAALDALAREKAIELQCLMDTKDSEYSRLKAEKDAEIERLKTRPESWASICLSYENEITQLEADKKALADALEKYGKHERGCLFQSRCPGYCACGWVDADAPHRIILKATPRPAVDGGKS